MSQRSTFVRVLWFSFVLVLALIGCGKKNEPDSQETPPISSGGEGGTSAGDSIETMLVIEEQVSAMRGLETLQPVAKAYLTPDELRQRIESEYEEDYSEQEAHDDVLLLVAFELVEPDLDLYNLLIDLQVEQVLGFYDPETDEMFVIKGDEAPGALERTTYAHEYVHVLQDQHFDLEALGFTDDEGEGEEEDSERLFAIRSLVEGDATLLQQQHLFRHFSSDDLQEMIDELSEMDTSVMDSAPPVLSETLMFPYDAGLAFVTTLYSEGKWSAVDAAYANPPLSTEQIMHPERYPDDVPQIVSLPPLTDTLGAGWRLVDEDVLGEFQLGLYLDVHVDSEDAATAAEGWGGDRYAVHWREDESGFVLVLRLAWDTSAGAVEFFDVYNQFAEDRFGAEGLVSENGAARLWSSDDDVLLLQQNSQYETLVIIAPDEATLEAVHALFPEF